MKIFITGVCGFVGSSLAESLLERHENLSICGVDNLMRPGSEINRARLRQLGVRFIHADIRAASDFESLPAADWVIDAAANPSVLAGVQAGSNSRQLFEHNLAGLVNVLEYCKARRAGLVLLSSSRVYSICALCSIPLKEDHQTFRLDESRPLPSGLTLRGIGREFSTNSQSRFMAVRNSLRKLSRSNTAMPLASLSGLTAVVYWLDRGSLALLIRGFSPIG